MGEFLPWFNVLLSEILCALLIAHAHIAAEVIEAELLIIIVDNEAAEIFHFLIPLFKLQTPALPVAGYFGLNDSGKLVDFFKHMLV